MPLKKRKKSAGKINHTITEVDGIKFHSKLESKYYLYLLELKEQGIVKDFKLQPEYILQEKFIIVNNKPILGSEDDFNKIKRKTKQPTIQAIKYIADFLVEYTDGTIEVIDTKGRETVDFNIKKKMFAYKYPHLKLRVIAFDKKLGWIDYSVYKNKSKKPKGME